jgi:hypothetical protein
MTNSSKCLFQNPPNIPSLISEKDDLAAGEAFSHLKSSLKVVTNEKGEAPGAVLTIRW